jgi:hypothetical protein
MFIFQIFSWADATTVICQSEQIKTIETGLNITVEKDSIGSWYVIEAPALVEQKLFNSLNIVQGEFERPTLMFELKMYDSDSPQLLVGSILKKEPFTNAKIYAIYGADCDQIQIIQQIGN